VGDWQQLLPLRGEMLLLQLATGNFLRLIFMHMQRNGGGVCILFVAKTGGIKYASDATRSSASNSN